MPARLAPLVVLVLAVGCFGGAAGSGRYTLATDPASRYGFRHVRDRQSGLWVHRECEARVSVARTLPDPLVSEEHGALLHTQRFSPESAETGSLEPARFDVADGFRVWRFRDLPDEDDLFGRTALGIQVEWPKPGAPSDWEPMELFAFPPMPAMAPEVWSAWGTAASQRAGAFGWWDEVHGAPPEPTAPVAFPFALRCRLLLKDHLYVD